MSRVEELINFLKEEKIENFNFLDENKENEIKIMLAKALYDDEELSPLYDFFKEHKSIDWLEEAIEEVKEDGAFILKELRQSKNEEILPDIFSNTVICNRIKFIKNKYKDLLPKEKMEALINEFYDISDFCIRNNYDGEEFKRILIQTYHINEKVAEEIGDVFTKHKMELKMDYIIQNLLDNEE